MYVLFKMIAWILIPLGIVIVWKAGVIVDAIGDNQWAIDHFGSTEQMVQIIGVVMSLLAIMWVTGGLQMFLGSTLAPFMGA